MRNCEVEFWGSCESSLVVGKIRRNHHVTMSFSGSSFYCVAAEYNFWPTMLGRRYLKIAVVCSKKMDYYFFWYVIRWMILARRFLSIIFLTLLPLIYDRLPCFKFLIKRSYFWESPSRGAQRLDWDFYLLADLSCLFLNTTS